MKRPAEPTAGKYKEAGPFRMLVVDDHRDSADSLSMLLSMAGNIVATAYDGIQAIAIAEEFCPHVVLLDIGLPDMSGYEVASRLRQRFGFERLLLIATTAWGTKEDRIRTQAVGFDYHLQKPYEMDQLLQAMSTIEAR